MASNLDLGDDPDGDIEGYDGGFTLVDTMSIEEQRALEHLLHEMARPLFVWRMSHGNGRPGSEARGRKALVEIRDLILAAMADKEEAK